MDATGEDAPHYRDLRSGYQSKKRERKQVQKYFGYRGVKLSWPGQLVYAQPNDMGPLYSQSAPLLTHPGTIKVKQWTKRDQFESRTFDIWPLDQPHKKGRRNRCNICYVPPRWVCERSTKGSRKLLDWECDQACVRFGWRVMYDVSYLEPNRDLELYIQALMDSVDDLTEYSSAKEDESGLVVDDEDDDDLVVSDMEPVLVSPTCSSLDGADEDDFILIPSFAGDEVDGYSDSDVEWQLLDFNCFSMVS